MASVFEKLKDGVEVAKAVGKTVVKRALGDDSPTELPKETDERVKKQAGMKPKKQEKK